MSMMGGGRLPQGLEAPGQAIASFPTYEAAQKAVSTLIAAEIPARDIAIVGHDLRSVERVTGRLGYAEAARSGAINGLLLGMLFSAILVLGSPSVPIQAFVGVLFVGIAIGMLLSLVTYSLVRRRRDFASVMQVVAERYDVTVSASDVAKARGVLGPRATAPAAVPATAATAGDEPASAPAADGTDAADGTESPGGTPADAEPPRYGERVTPPPSAGSAPDER
ncbi:general stress protein [Microbacterium invictum]|uniref:General stress protein n=1 Tax=Microbacterium invictum TaxID=515415 RepID=A0ABZ0VG70_9MICO|nr:general stress protein [Microbacterium invictum]WQB71807.1 general stress protein [Microbacterium invictum]